MMRWPLLGTASNSLAKVSVKGAIQSLDDALDGEKPDPLENLCFLSNANLLN